MTHQDDLMKQFDERWKNLYTVMPGLGQGDARRAVKQFIQDNYIPKTEVREVVGETDKPNIQEQPDEWVICETCDMVIEDSEGCVCAVKNQLRAEILQKLELEE